ncbi:MAG: DUF1801 domain-containing protein [Actinomycetota bacterium]
MSSEAAEVSAYIDTVRSPTRQREAEKRLALLERITGQQPRMWGSSIVGYGHYHYKYESGREGDGPAASFSARKAATVVYLPDGIGAHAERLSRLGPHTTGVGCLYIKDLSAVDLDVLEQIIRSSYETLSADTYRHRARESDAGRRG